MKRTKKMDVPEDFFRYVREKKAQNPDQFKTNYDVFDYMIGKPLPQKRQRGDFWGRI